MTLYHMPREKVCKHATPHLVLKSFRCTLCGGRGDDVGIVPASDVGEVIASLHRRALGLQIPYIIRWFPSLAGTGIQCMQRSFSNWKHSHHFSLWSNRISEAIESLQLMGFLFHLLVEGVAFQWRVACLRGRVGLPWNLDHRRCEWRSRSYWIFVSNQGSHQRKHPVSRWPSPLGVLEKSPSNCSKELVNWRYHTNNRKFLEEDVPL